MDPLGVFDFRCPHCGVTVWAKNRMIGQTKPCPKCDKSIVIDGRALRDKDLIDSVVKQKLQRLAIQAADLVQIAMNENKDSGGIANMIFLLVPEFEELGSAFKLCPKYTVKAWAICSEIRQIFETNGRNYKDYWHQLYCARNVSDLKNKSQDQLPTNQPLLLVKKPSFVDAETFQEFDIPVEKPTQRIEKPNFRIEQDGQVYANWNSIEEAKVIRQQIGDLLEAVKIEIRSIKEEQRQLNEYHKTTNRAIGPSLYRYSRSGIGSAMYLIQTIGKALVSTKYASRATEIEQRRQLLSVLQLNLLRVNLQVGRYIKNQGT